MPENAEGKVTKHTLSGQTIAKLLGGKGIRYRLGEVFPDRVEIYAQSNRSGCRCPDCQEKSTANHSSYQRNLQSLPIDGKRVTIHLIVRKYRCRNPGCGRRIFAEQLPGMTEERSRRTVKARTFLESLLLEVSSVKGAYLTRIAGMPNSPSTCLRLVNRISVMLADPSRIKRICIDDFAYRKGQNYGTMIIDADTHEVLELFRGRSAEVAANALAKYTGLKEASRDRAGGYARALEKSTPHAEQIADRFHLVKNCGEHMEEQLRASADTILKELQDAFRTENPPPPDPEPLAERRTSIRESKYYGAIVTYHSRGMSEEQIHRKYRYRRNVIGECIRDARYRQVLPFIREAARAGAPLDRLRALANLPAEQGARDFGRWVEDVFPGYMGRSRTLRKKEKEYYGRYREMTRDIVNNRKLKLYVANPDYGVHKKTGECSREHEMMEEAILKSPTLNMLRKFVSSFREIIKGDNPYKMDDWIDEYERSGLDSLANFAQGLRTDIGAVKNAISHDINNGPIEGKNNKLKALKRSMYGRAGNHLLMVKMIRAKTG